MHASGKLLNLNANTLVGFGAIVFLLSDKASYINGDILMVDNGASLRSPK